MYMWPCPYGESLLWLRCVRDKQNARRASSAARDCIIFYVDKIIMFIFEPSTSGGKVESVMDRQIDGSEMRSVAQI